MLKIEVDNGEYEIISEGESPLVMTELTVVVNHILRSALKKDAPKEYKDKLYNTFVNALMKIKDKEI